MNEQILHEIADFCRRHGLAETTFGRRAVNDGKLVARLRSGGRITTDTLERIRSFMAEAQLAPATRRLAAEGSSAMPDAVTDPQRNFRFFDNRQKYLLFVNTCSEKREIAHRVGLELGELKPRPPAVRLFDAGLGDGTVLSHVMRDMHERFRHIPFYVVGKEISVEDIRLTLQKMADRFYEHPATVLVLTNLNYRDAPWLTEKNKRKIVWHELVLSGNSSHAFEEQIAQLEPFLAENWKARVSPQTGRPVYDRPVVLTLVREDHRFVLDPVMPKPGAVTAEFDLVIASRPYRARSPLAFKARQVIAPLARALAPGGRLLGVHSYGRDPGMEIVRKIWPDDRPFTHDRNAVLKAVKQGLGDAARDFTFEPYTDKRSLFRYGMHTLPSEISAAIGTSTLLAAWNAAIYVGQVEDDRLSGAQRGTRYIEATREVLRKHGGLWFYDESFVIAHKAG